MEDSRPCKSCRKRTVVPHEETGNPFCTSCGVVQDYDNFQSNFGGIDGPTGVFIRVGTAGSGSQYKYRETKIYEAQKMIEDLMFNLGFSGHKSNEVKVMIETITEGEYGMGDWFPVLIGACAYVVTRKDNKPMSVAEIADSIKCDIYEFGQMVNRVVKFLDLKLPVFDIVNSFERVVRTCPSFIGVEEDKVERMLKQGILLVQCLVKWYITTGRRPMQVVAAVAVFVAELNQVQVKIEALAKDLKVAVSTCRLRYKELLERLVRLASSLPWGKDVNVKNIMKNAHFVIQYLEMKSMAKNGGKGKEKGKSLDDDFRFDLDDLVGDCLTAELEYGDYGFGDTENGFGYFQLEQSPMWSIDDLEKSHVSLECLSEVYSKFLGEVSEVKSKLESEDHINRRKRRKVCNYNECTEWWKGKSDMSKKLFLKEILEKDVGLNANPPSFDRGCLVYQRRREKIKAAKLRIEKVRRPLPGDSGDGYDFSLSKCTSVGKRKKEKRVDVGWEDFIIETLLLHGVKEEEIETGYYQNLMALHVFN